MTTLVYYHSGNYYMYSTCILITLKLVHTSDMGHVIRLHADHLYIKYDWIPGNKHKLVNKKMTEQFSGGAPINGNIDLSVGHQHPIRWSILNLMVDSGSYCWKPYMFNFILCFCLHTDKNLAIYPAYFSHSVKTHFWTILLIYCPD